MDNIAIARMLDETAALLEIDAADPFRIRSYRRAAEAVEQQTSSLESLVADDPKQLLAISGIGKGMAANITAIIETGTLPLRAELLQKYKPTMLELLRLPGMGPKSVALLWSALGVADLDSLCTKVVSFTDGGAISIVRCSSMAMAALSITRISTGLFDIRRIRFTPKYRRISELNS